MSKTIALLLLILILIVLLLLFVIVLFIRYLSKNTNFGFKKGWLRKRIFYSKNKKKIKVDDLTNFISSFSSTLSRLSHDKVGALIVIENADNLEKYIQIGNKVDSKFLPEFVYSIFFNHASALHDGAMILRNFRITSISSYLPLTKRLLSVSYGARHRAAFGIAERTDALAFVVSETSGQISCMYSDEEIKFPSESILIANQLVDLLFKKYQLLVMNKNPSIIQQIKASLN